MVCHQNGRSEQVMVCHQNGRSEQVMVCNNETQNRTRHRLGTMHNQAPGKTRRPASSPQLMAAGEGRGAAFQANSIY